MWFSPLKGAHLTLGQLDKTLPVDISGEDNANKKIERGTFVYIANGTGTSDVPQFKIYTSEKATAANAVPYIALMGVYDFQAGMAGNVGQAPEPEADGISKGTAATGAALKFIDKPTIEGTQAVYGPRITAISIVQAGEYQTSAYTGTDFYVGQPLTVGEGGKLVAWDEGMHIVGYVTATPKKRWVNDLGASSLGARISGGNVNVIEFSTAWIPAAATKNNVAKLQKVVTAEKKVVATPAASAPKAATTK